LADLRPSDHHLKDQVMMFESIRGSTVGCLGAAALVAAVAVPATHGQTWTGNFSSDWNTFVNWAPNGVPNSATATPVFSGNHIGTVNISSSVVAQSLTFSNTTGNYTLTSGAGQTLSVNDINVAAGVTGTQTINLANVVTGSLLSTGYLEIMNNSTSSATSLAIGPNTVFGSTSNQQVQVSGAGTTQISGSFAGSSNQVRGLFKLGPGTLNFGGNGANLGADGLAVLGGTLVLDYSANTATKLGTATKLFLQSGVLSLTKNAGTPIMQTIPGGTILEFGHTDVQATGSGTVTLAAGSILHSSSASVDFNVGGTTGFSVTTTTGTTNGLLGTGPAYATIGGGSTWATVSGGAIAGLNTYGTNTYTANANVDVTGSTSQSNITVNSLRFNNSATSLAFSGTNTLQSAGILVTPAGGNSTITGGIITAPSGGELYVHQYAPSGFTINSALVATYLTKTGLGTLTLGGNNAGLTGEIIVHRGGLTVTNAAAVNSSSEIILDDFRTGGALQTFTVDLGNNTAGTIKPLILVSAFSASGAGTVFSTGSSLNSRVTLGRLIYSNAPSGGPIGSFAGTPIGFTGDFSNTSGFNLTQDATTDFIGNLTLSHGFLGITSDACLGDPANTLFLGVGSTTAGGLELLSNSATVQHSITLTAPTRVIVDGGNIDTIAGAVSATALSARLVKAGPGRLDFTGDGSSDQGGIALAGGSLFLNYSANSAHKSGGATLDLNGGTLVLIPNASTPVSETVLFTNVASGHTDVIATGSGTLIFNLGTMNRTTGATLDVSSANGASFTANTSAGQANDLLGSGPAFATFGSGATWATGGIGSAIVGLPAR
jgi:hypothetical protein